MRNDEQSVDDEPMIIHGGGTINLQGLTRYRKKIPVLLPFDRINPKKELVWEPWWSYLFVDSGAFSISQKNASVNLDSYIRFLKEQGNKINHYAALDVVGDGEASLTNWRKMRKEGLYPIPVYHDGEPWRILEEYVNNCSYVGLGAVAYKSNKARLTFFDRIFEQFPDRTKVGFHGFGVFSFDLMKRYPWRSVDSSTLNVVCRNGSILFGGHFVKQISLSSKSDQKLKERWFSEFNEEQVRKMFDEFGLDYEKAKQGDAEGYVERTMFSLDYVEKFVKIPKKFNPSVKVSSLVNW